MPPATARVIDSRTVRLLVAVLALSTFAVACNVERLTRPGGPGGGPAGLPKLTWAPPALNAPVTKLAIRTRGGHYDGAGRDCRVTFPDAAVTRRTDIEGCHDVVIVGGEIRLGGSVSVDSTDGVGLWVRDFTGVAHIEGLRIRGAGLSDGLWISSAADGATAQVENVRVDAVHAARPVTSCMDVPHPHPDLIQLFQGPETLRLDRFTGYTPYTGLYVNSGATSPRKITERLQLRNGNIELLNGKCGIASLFDERTLAAATPTTIANFWGQPNGRGTVAFYPYRKFRPEEPEGQVSPRWWGGFKIGDPPAGDFVPAARVGLDYRSPGYVR